jgi:hypothetical protein
MNIATRTTTGFKLMTVSSSAALANSSAAPADASSMQPTNESVVLSFFQKTRANQRLDDEVALIFVDHPEAAHLGAGQRKTGHLLILCACSIEPDVHSGFNPRHRRFLTLESTALTAVTAL